MLPWKYHNDCQRIEVSSEIFPTRRLQSWRGNSTCPVDFWSCVILHYGGRRTITVGEVLLLKHWYLSFLFFSFQNSVQCERSESSEFRSLTWSYSMNCVLRMTRRNSGKNSKSISNWKRLDFLTTKSMVAFGSFQSHLVDWSRSSKYTSW